MAGLIDSHCHLTYDGLRERIEEVLANAAATGITDLVTIATSLADAERALALSAAHRQIHVVAGIHPHESGKAAPGWDAALLPIVRRGDVYAVGEMGLDYHYDFAPRDMQAAVFRRQLQMAMDVSKSVVIHCREAHADVLTILAEFPKVRNVVFHCFTGTKQEATEILDRGYWISLTGVVTFKRSDELREVARMIPDDRLMVETDSPYLSPEPVRNMRPNEPANVRYTADCIATARGMTPDALADMTTANARRFFGLTSS